MARLLHASCFAVMVIVAGCDKDTTIITEEGSTIHIASLNHAINTIVFNDFKKESNTDVQYRNYTTENDFFYDLYRDEITFDIAIVSNQLAEQLYVSNMIHMIQPEKSSAIVSIISSENEIGIEMGWKGYILVANQMMPSRIEGWSSIFSKPECAVALPNQPLIVYASTMLHLGFNPNDFNISHLQKAHNLLVDGADNFLLYNGKEGKISSSLKKNEVCMALVDSGLLDNLEQIDIEVPKEGAIKKNQKIVILKNSQSHHIAESFINFLFSPKNSDVSSILKKNNIPLTSKQIENFITLNLPTRQFKKRAIELWNQINWRWL